MNKSDVIEYLNSERTLKSGQIDRYGGAANLSRLLGVSRPAITHMYELMPPARAFTVYNTYGADPKCPRPDIRKYCESSGIDYDKFLDFCEVLINERKSTKSNA